MLIVFVLVKTLVVVLELVLLSVDVSELIADTILLIFIVLVFITDSGVVVLVGNF